ncbi:Lnb N-terminal periplasmic domain-containing protein [Eudoraea adriatica]|uniref:Lnb N-terminal periplasmic domain-containing protein n=1 Tax=Eudoraea adriatica TaxID=446681 RepID=UPI001F0AEC98|nr:DUF4105 domain-containing protein [Eudoraea adriatica]
MIRALRIPFKKLCFINSLWIALLGFSLQAQLSEGAQISILTCDSGRDLYSSFGHSAFRVQDSANGINWVYNYGTFDFNTPNFYYKFAKGKLLYSLSVSTFSDFLFTYELENRWVKEQILNLSPEEKNDLFLFLENNRKPKNRDYKYDFLFDNCATKLPEVLKKVLGNNIQFHGEHLKNKFSFRDLIQQNLLTNSWSSFGIDLALGSVIDREAAPEEYMFLPKYVMLQMQNTSLDANPLVQRERSVLEYSNKKFSYNFGISPLFWLLLLFLFILTISYIDLRNGTRSRWLDFFLFLTTGLAGLLIFFLWFMTDHSATANNFNILWAFPFNIVACYFLLRKNSIPKWMGKYILILLVLMAITLLLWIFQIQQFSPLISVVFATLGFRYALLYRYFTNINPGLK